MNRIDMYNRLPVFAQNVAFSLAGWNIQRTRYGKGFYEKLAEFESHENWSADQLISWRNERLKKIVVHAYTTVPFYKEFMDDGGVNPASIVDEASLAQLPIITKDMIKANPQAFVSSEAKNLNLLHVHTSGTTGSGFQFESTIECQQAQFACFWRYYKSHGLSLGTWEAQFSSRAAVPLSTTKPPFWRIDIPGRRYYMSAFHENPVNMQSYYDLIARKKLEWISGYPSLMVLLAQWMNERDLKFDFVKAVTCGAENLLKHQAEAMDRAFGVKPIQTYGQTENVAIFSTRPDGKVRVDEDFSVVEFLPAGDDFEVVGTCLFNYATPLIRYKTKDTVTLGNCAGPWREIASLDGRQEDYIMLPNGTKVGKLDHVFKDTPHIREAQIYQYADYSIELRLVVNATECTVDERVAVAELRKSIGDSIPIKVVHMEKIPRKTSAKLRFVVSEASY